MKIAVCIKQVPASTDVKLDPVTNNLVRDDAPGVINPYDLHAIEEAVRVKERYGGTITAISMGPPAASEALREAISLGVDEVALISDRSFAGADTLATAYTLSKALEKIGPFDLIICGKQSVDGDTGQVGPEMAQMLNTSLATSVSNIEEVDSGKVILKRMVEDGYLRVEANLPLLITVTKEINIPRIPSLKGMMKAKKEEIPTLSAEEIGADQSRIGILGSPTKVRRVYKPISTGPGQMIEGTPSEAARSLLKKLKESKIV